MIISKVVTQIRGKTSDPKPDGEAGQKKTDAEIIAYINLTVQSLFRQRSDADSSYGLVHFKISGTSTSRVFSLTETSFRYVLPSWVHVVAFVREDMDGDGVLGRPIPPNFFESVRFGWYWESDHSIIVRGCSTPPDLIFSVQRIPSPVHSGTVRKAATAADMIPLDLESNMGGTFDPEDGAYIGAKIEVTGGQDTVGGTRDPRGRVSTITDQVRAWDPGVTAFVTEVTCQPAPTSQVAVNDTYEFHVDLQSSEINYLVLLVAAQIWHESHNTNALNSIAEDLAEERRSFIDGIQPRQDMAPSFQQGNFSGGLTDEDRDAVWMSGFSI